MPSRKISSVLITLVVNLMLSACGGNSNDTPTLKETAINKITAYAENEANPAPTLQDYLDAGVTGVTNENLSALNSVVENMESQDVDTTEELNILTAGLDINIAPVANAGDDKTVEVNKSITIIGTATDSDGNIVTYEWKNGPKVLSTNATFDYTPTMVGTDTLTLTVSDNDGESASDQMNVLVTAAPVDPVDPPANPVDPVNPPVSSVDSKSPEVINDDALIISDITQALSFTVTDESVINTASLVVNINGINRNSLAKFSSGKVNVTPDAANFWNAGVLNVSISIADIANNIATKTFIYTVQPNTAALPIAVPSSGNAPLMVQLTPFNTTGTAIEQYSWDFDGDGTYDLSETVGRNQKYTFNTPGSYATKLKITDSEGNEVIGSVNITVNNAAPEVSASAQPSNGSLPLSVNFISSATDNEGIATYSWDFDGDGTFDLTEPNASSATHVYQTLGSFQPVLEVSDTLGGKTTYAFSDIHVQVHPANYPVVSAIASPSSGNAPLNVGLSTTATPAAPRTITKYEWDFDGDGTFDETSATTGTTTHSFKSAGIFFAKVRVTDSDNQSSEDVVKIEVKASLSMSIVNETIDTSAAETTTITTTLGGDTKMSLVMEDRFGTLVKTLVPETTRTAGSYDDIWDGKDDQGDFVVEGDYRAVVLYDLDGKTERFDLSTSTGGNSFNPPRTRIPRNFQPFAGKPLNIDFTLNKASDVTAFMGRFNVNTRLITFMQRLPLGKGTHRISWNGEDSTGQLIHPPAGDSFLFGIFGFTFPDNAIYVRSGTHITDLAVAPSIFVPDSVNNPTSKLTFTLSNVGDARLLVYNADEGSLVASRSFTGLTVGENTVSWDGKNDAGVLVSPGKYRLGVSAIDSKGFQSITNYVVQQVYY